MIPNSLALADRAKAELIEQAAKVPRVQPSPATPRQPPDGQADQLSMFQTPINPIPINVAAVPTAATAGPKPLSFRQTC